MDNETQQFLYLKCTGCHKVIKEDLPGFNRNLGKDHAYFWNGPAACRGKLVEHIPEVKS